LEIQVRKVETTLKKLIVQREILRECCEIGLDVVTDSKSDFGLVRFGNLFLIIATCEQS
jgi:hypothetical protein